MKYYVALILLAPVAFSQQHRSSTYTYDVNGNAVKGPTISESAAPGAERKATTVRNANGRNVPVESVEEKVISNIGGVRIVERLVKRYDANGVPGPPEKIRIEERKNADGSGTVQTTVLRADINGNYALTERSVADIRKSGDTTMTTTVIDRATVNGSLETVAKREETERKSTKGDLSRNSTTFQKDANGRLSETAREDVERKVENGTTEESAATYEATNGQLELVQQTVSKTVKSPSGEHTEVNVFEPTIAGRAVSNDTRPQLRKQQIIEKTPTPSGAVETMSVRWTSPDAPTRLGPAQKVQETVCTGECK